MAEQNNNEVLLIDDSFMPLITENDAENLKPLQRKFMESYIIHKDTMSIEEWLPMELQVNLPEKSDEEIEQISSEIITTIKLNEEKKHSLEQAIKNGRSKESWFESETKKLCHI